MFGYEAAEVQDEDRGTPDNTSGGYHPGGSDNANAVSQGSTWTRDTLSHIVSRLWDIFYFVLAYGMFDRIV